MNVQNKHTRESFAASPDRLLPQVYHKLLPRKGISRVINGAFPREAVCLTAPYGSGKTLAVLSWLQERGLPAAWLTLRAADNSGPAFQDGLAAAVLGRGDGPEERENILVIDNFHFITDTALLRFVKDFIHAALGRWHVIIITRAELPTVFNDLVLKKHICLITQKDLSFSAEEMADYFTLNDCAVPKRDIERLRDDTEGWPAALNVVLTVTRGGPVGYRESAQEYVNVFFETEIWEGLSESLKDFLLKTSILDTLTPSACRAVTGNDAALPVLKTLLMNGLFVSRLDERNTYRYHRVFRGFLLDKLRTSSLDERELNKMAAWWLFDRNEYIQSFPYFFKSGDLYCLSQVLRHVNPSVMGIERFLEITDCITTLNVEDLKPYPIIVARMALINYIKGNIAEMQALYGTFLEWISPGELPIPPEEYAEYVWEAGWLCYLDPDEEVRNNTKHEEWTNYQDYVPHLAQLHRARGAVLRFPSMLRGVRDYCSVLGNVEDFLRRAEETGYSPVRNEVSVWETELILAEYAYELEDFEKSEKITRRIMPLAEELELTDLYFVCAALLAKLLRAAGAHAEIDALTARLEAMIVSREMHFLLPNFRAFALRNRLAAGQPGLPEAFEKENRPYINKPYFYLLYRHIALARGLSSTGAYSEAMLILGQLDLLCQKYRRTMDLIEINILYAVALFGEGYEESARARLTAALEQARPYGFIRIFSDDAKDIWPILELVKKSSADKHTKAVVISCKKAVARNRRPVASKSRAFAELTKTELKVLRSLEAGMSYLEIAQDNGIRMSTVKSHVHSIYSKLDVDNKTSAVMAARNMGILEPLRDSGEEKRQT